MKTIGERIRKKRQELKYTLEKLANEIGVTPSTILKYENGSINIPSDKIEKLSSILDCSPAYLMGWTDKEKFSISHEISHLSQSPRFRWVARNAKKMTDEDLLKLQNLMKAAFEKIDFDRDDNEEE